MPKDTHQPGPTASPLELPEQVSEAFAATHGLTMPSQLRRMLRAQGRDLHGEFLRLLPEPPRSLTGNSLLVRTGQ